MSVKFFHIFAMRLSAIVGANRQSITRLHLSSRLQKNTRCAHKLSRVSFFSPYLRLLCRSWVTVPYLSLAQEREFKELHRGFIILTGSAGLVRGVDTKANEHRMLISILERYAKPFRDWYIYSGLQARILRVTVLKQKHEIFE